MLNPGKPLIVALTVTNHGGSAATVPSARVNGRVMALSFFNYDTQIGLKVPANGTAHTTFSLGLTDLGGQADGQLPATVSLLNSNADEIATHSFTVDVKGKLSSIYGIFGLAILGITVLWMISLIYRLVTRTLPPNRWSRAVQFSAAGFGVGLTLTFSVSVLRLLTPSAVVWVPFVLGAGLIGLAVGYITPGPRPRDDEDDDDQFAAEHAARQPAFAQAGASHSAFAGTSSTAGLGGGPGPALGGDGPRGLEQPPPPVGTPLGAQGEQRSPQGVGGPGPTPSGPRRPVLGRPVLPVPRSRTTGRSRCGARTNPTATRTRPSRRTDRSWTRCSAASTAPASPAGHEFRSPAPQCRLPPARPHSRGTAMTAPAAIAAALPSYEIGPELGRGGFGIVYAGRQRHLGRDVAIKQLPPSFSNDEEIRSRFATEARVLASLDHPHIVPIYDYVEREGLCLLVMECLTGGSVWDTFRKDGLTPARACVLVVATAAGLHHAHVNGVLHRDVKPENLLLTANNHLKVTDFGIAKVIGGADAVATSDGGILGTPAYMAPEQADGGDLSAAADVYAAGTMLYELLSGTLPFSQDGGGLAIVYRHLYEQPNPLRDIAPQVPQPLADVVMRSIARQPSDRYGTAEEFAIAIGEAAVESFGEDWYQASGLRVIGSDVMMGTLTGGGRDRRRAASTTIADSSVAPAGWNPEGNRGQRPTTGEQGRDAGDGTISAPFENLLAPPPGQQQGPGGPRPTPGQPSQGYPSQGYPSGDPRASQPGYPGHGPTPGGPNNTPGGPNAPASYQYGSLVPYESAQLPVMRPSIFVHVVGEVAPDAKPEPLVPVRQILNAPPIPAVMAALTTVVLLALLVVAYVGLSTGVDRSGTVQSTVTLAGTDVVDQGRHRRPRQLGAPLGEPAAGRCHRRRAQAVRPQDPDRLVGQAAARALRQQRHRDVQARVGPLPRAGTGDRQGRPARRRRQGGRQPPGAGDAQQQRLPHRPGRRRRARPAVRAGLPRVAGPAAVAAWQAAGGELDRPGPGGRPARRGADRHRLGAAALRAERADGGRVCGDRRRPGHPVRPHGRAVGPACAGPAHQQEAVRPRLTVPSGLRPFAGSLSASLARVLAGTPRRIRPSTGASG